MVHTQNIKIVQNRQTYQTVGGQTTESRQSTMIVRNMTRKIYNNDDKDDTGIIHDNDGNRPLIALHNVNNNTH